MVLLKRLDYGFSGYQFPPTPRATRSVRRRSSFRKKGDEEQMCAFDLLATVAGKLLLEGENSPSSCDTPTGKIPSLTVKDSVKREQQDLENPLKLVTSDQGSCHSRFSVSENVPKTPISGHSPKESSLAQNDDCSGRASIVTTSVCSEKVVDAEKLVDDKNNVQQGSFANKLETPFCVYQVSCNCIKEDDSQKQIKMEPAPIGSASNSKRIKIPNLDDPVAWESKPPALVSLDNSVKLPLCKDHTLSSSPVCRDDVKIVVRDDDENSSGCTQPRTTIKASRPPAHVGDRRIRKLLASRYQKLNPLLRSGHFDTDAETKPVYHNRKNLYKWQRSQRDYPFKKRKIYYTSSVSNSDSGVCSEGICNSPRMGLGGDASASGSPIQGASGKPASQNMSFKSRDSHVRLRIKSFKVPEFFIEIPETSTVGSLKRRVMEAVTAILGSGLRVGVLVEGKKVRDDNKTLLQTGISHDNKPDALGFSLEPTSSQAPLSHKNQPFLLPCETPKPLTRYAPAPSVEHNVAQQRTSDPLPDPPLTNLGNFVESDHDSAPSPPDMLSSLDKSTKDSKAQLAVTAMNVEALSMVPMRKSKRSEAVQRRIRRPFSVAEVEALVQAVEKLGTGRWRDVKLRAFDNAKHRTYVDLKDKWKTLVHTARISPQQRRGEPVPQDLLNRVLVAHAYWSQHQAKQQFKQQPELCLL